ncbi:MAG: hypothetical protein HN370_01915 [Phycisphaerales bacterium]|nr:hypothetical protein [Phycisphaerales bacterium]
MKLHILIVLCAAGIAAGLAVAAEPAAAGPTWPQTIRMPEGTVVIHPGPLHSQPQNTLRGRISVSVLATGMLRPAHGEIVFTSPYRTDEAKGSLVCHSAKVVTMVFPTATSPAEKSLLASIRSRIGLWEINFSLDRLDAKPASATEGDILPPMDPKAAPAKPAAPKPLTAEDLFGESTSDGQPAAPVATAPQPRTPHLQFIPPQPEVTYRSEPLFALVDGGYNVYYATNANRTVLRHAQTYYINAGQLWYSGSRPHGPWTLTWQLPWSSGSGVSTTVSVSGVGSRSLLHRPTLIYSYGGIPYAGVPYGHYPHWTSPRRHYGWGMVYPYSSFGLFGPEMPYLVTGSGGLSSVQRRGPLWLPTIALPTIWPYSYYPRGGGSRRPNWPRHTGYPGHTHPGGNPHTGHSGHRYPTWVKPAVPTIPQPTWGAPTLSTTPQPTQPAPTTPTKPAPTQTPPITPTNPRSARITHKR